MLPAGQTLLSKLGHVAFGSGPLYYYLQATTALILILAANTSFADFPRLLYLLARDKYAPTNSSASATGWRSPTGSSRWGSSPPSSTGTSRAAPTP